MPPPFTPPLVIASLAAAIFCSTTAQAYPLQRDQVSDEAKWILHIDLDQLRNTQVGSFLINDLLRSKLEKEKENIPFDFNLPLDKVHGITAYGTDFEKGPEANGVLMVHADPKIHEVLVALLIQQAEAGKAGEGPVKQLRQDDTGVYSVKDEIFISVKSGDHLLLGKSLKHVEQARETLHQRKNTLEDTDSFKQFPETVDAFFFLATAQGFSANQSIPPQARILQMADAARLILGESSENLFLDLSLKSSDPEVSNQIQMVLQGMVALVSLSQQENPDLMAIANSAKVNRTNQLVSVNLRVPIAKVMEKLKEHVYVEAEQESDSKEQQDASKESAPQAESQESDSPQS